MAVAARRVLAAVLAAGSVRGWRKAHVSASLCGLEPRRWPHCRRPASSVHLAGYVTLRCRMSRSVPAPMRCGGGGCLASGAPLGARRILEHHRHRRVTKRKSFASPGEYPQFLWINSPRATGASDQGHAASYLDGRFSGWSNTAALPGPPESWLKQSSISSKAMYRTRVDALPCAPRAAGLIFWLLLSGSRMPPEANPRGPDIGSIPAIRIWPSLTLRRCRANAPSWKPSLR